MVFKYHIEYWDELDEAVEEEEGILIAESYSKAVKKLEEYYGIANISAILSLVDYDAGEHDVITDDDLLNIGYIKKSEETDAD